MKTYYRIPKWEVTIRRPDYSSTVLTYKSVRDWSKSGTGAPAKLVFSSSPSSVNPDSGYTDLIGYEYENSISNPVGGFTLNFVLATDKIGRTWKDRIQSRDLVFISEFGVVRYIGVVRNTSYSMNINNETPNRSITISGESIGGILHSYNVPMNVYLWFDVGATAGVENDKFVAALQSKANQGQGLKGIIKSLTDGFIKISTGAQLTGFGSVLNKFFSLEAQDMKAKYPLSYKPYQVESNNAFGMLRQLLPYPIYEIFGIYEKEKYKLICRETPFDTSDWNTLPMTELNPLYLTSQEISDSDNEVFTHYYSQLPLALYSENDIYASTALNEVSVFDKEKLATYGYKKLEANFPFFDLDKGKDQEYKDVLKQNSARMYAWYKNNVEFQAGTIEVMTVPDSLKRLPNPGERMQYLKGSNYSIQFYIEGMKRRMSFPDKMISTYTVTRGYEYGVGSVTVDGITISTPQLNKISNVGQKLYKAERDN